jgi:hypothetical protein
MRRRCSVGSCSGVSAVMAQHVRLALQQCTLVHPVRLHPMPPPIPTCMHTAQPAGQLVAAGCEGAHCTAQLYCLLSCTAAVLLSCTACSACKAAAVLLSSTAAAGCKGAAVLLSCTDAAGCKGVTVLLSSYCCCIAQLYSCCGVRKDATVPELYHSDVLLLRGARALLYCSAVLLLRGARAPLYCSARTADVLLSCTPAAASVRTPLYLNCTIQMYCCCAVQGRHCAARYC